MAFVKWIAYVWGNMVKGMGSGMRTYLSVLGLSIMLGLAGCSTLPNHGPQAIKATLDDELALEAVDRRFTILQLDADLVRKIGAAPMTTLGGKFGPAAQYRSRVRLGIGDQLKIIIWEASPDGLFSTATRKETEISAVLDSAGNIYVPYVGKIRALGSRVSDVQTKIVSGLAKKTIDPQVQVLLTNSAGHKLSVVGDVAQSGRFDVPASGLRLIEAIALAGGVTQPGFETEVTVVRDAARGTVRFDNIINNTTNNIWLRPRDTIEVIHRPRKFSVFGAVTAQSLQKFGTEKVSLAEALAQSGGLNNNLSDAAGVFLFRFESKYRLRKINASHQKSKYSQGIPTIYRLNFSDPEAFFLSRSFMLHDQDIIFVANAPATEFQKFVSLIVSPFLSVNNSLD